MLSSISCEDDLEASASVSSAEATFFFDSATFSSSSLILSKYFWERPFTARDFVWYSRSSFSALARSSFASASSSVEDFTESAELEAAEPNCSSMLMPGSRLKLDRDVSSWRDSLRLDIAVVAPDISDSLNKSILSAAVLKILIYSFTAVLISFLALFQAFLALFAIFFLSDSICFLSLLMLLRFSLRLFLAFFMLYWSCFARALDKLADNFVLSE